MMTAFHTHETPTSIDEHERETTSILTPTAIDEVSEPAPRPAELSTPLTEPTPAPPDDENWAEKAERVKTRDMLVREVQSLALDADAATRKALEDGEKSMNKALQATRPLIKGMLEFVETFESGDTLDKSALDAFLDEQGVAENHGKTQNEWHRVVRLFESTLTSRAMLSKRAAVLAGLRIRNIRSHNVLTAFDEPEKIGRKSLSGLDRFVEIHRAEQRAKKQVQDETQQPEVDAASSSDLDGVSSKDNENALLPSLKATVARNALRVVVGDKVLPAIRVVQDGTVLTIFADTSKVGGGAEA